MGTPIQTDEQRADTRIPRPRMVLTRLSLMMLLEFMVYGSWFATVGLVLSKNGLASIVGTAFSLAAVAAIVSLMFTGAIADRFFSSQKVLAVLHTVGGVLMLFVGPAIHTGNGGLVLVAIFVYMLFFQPTLAMTQNIAFTHLNDESGKFAWVRAFGTAGWIVVGLFIGQSGLSASDEIFTVAAVLSFVLAIYSLSLPKTPPPARRNRFRLGDIVGSGAFYLFRSRSFVVLMVTLVLTAVPISIYNAYGSTYLSIAGLPNVASFLTIGQGSELLALIALPFVLRVVSIKWVLVVGLLAWIVRAGAFYLMTGGNIPLAIVIIAIHGICNDFFVMTASIFINEVTKAGTRAQAQSLFLLASFGVGNMIGSLVAGGLFNAFVGSSANVSSWDPMWYVTAGLTAIGAVLMVLFFRPTAHPTASDATRSIAAVREQTRRNRAAVVAAEVAPLAPRFAPGADPIVNDK